MLEGIEESAAFGEAADQRKQQTGEVDPIIASDSKSSVDYALTYGRNGYEILPIYEIGPDAHCSCAKGAACQWPGKHPRTAHGVKDATVLTK
jgi:hypothetical protein